MPRRARSIEGGLVYHILNRSNARMTLFEKDEDYAAFERVLEEAHEREPLRVLAYCVLPNHFLCEASHKSCYVKLPIM